MTAIHSKRYHCACILAVPRLQVEHAVGHLTSSAHSHSQVVAKLHKEIAALKATPLAVGNSRLASLRAFSSCTNNRT